MYKHLDRKMKPRLRRKSLSILLCDLRSLRLPRCMGLRDSADHSRVFFTVKNKSLPHTYILIWLY